MEKRPSFIKTDDNRVINEVYIRWIQKMGECMEVCSKMDGCSLENGATHRVCKTHNLTSYNRLNSHFQE